MVLAFAGIAVPVALSAQDTTAHADTAARVLPAVVTTVSRESARPVLDLPFAISTVRPDSARPGQRHLSIDETLFGLPGVTLANRNNPSQDARIAIRGFGARSAFGVRSVRLERDGIPLTLPDGQTPLDYIDLESVGSVDVLRGSAGALYGNAAGGVIELRSAPAPVAPIAGEIRSSSGSYDSRRVTALVGGTTAAAAYQANLGRTQADNFRDYAHQRLTNGFLRLTTVVGGTSFALTGMGLDMPLAENPGALTRAQADSAPWMADPFSVRKHARKEVRQVQFGLTAQRATVLGGQFEAQVNVGRRHLYNPLTFAVVGVERGQGGAGARLTIPGSVAGASNRFGIGADWQRQDDARRNWSNCNGNTLITMNCPALGAEKGALQLDQRELVSSLGAYARDELALGALRLSAGIRGDAIRFTLQDHFLGDGDDSGERTLHAVSPLVGAVVRLAPTHSAYATLSTAFETPTTTELGNHPDGSAGLNPDLRPQRSTTAETGVRGFLASGVHYDLALFHTTVRDELVQYDVAGGSGRTYYRNAGRTRRDGVEVALGATLRALDVEGSYAYSHFRFVDYTSGGADMAGHTIPGVPTHQLQGSATWHWRSAFVTGEAIARSATFANDANTAQADGYTVLNARLGATALFGTPWLSPIVGVSNLTDRRYVSSVAINASGSSLATTKFYEPAPGRTWFVGLSVGAGR